MAVEEKRRPRFVSTANLIDGRPRLGQIAALPDPGATKVLGDDGTGNMDWLDEGAPANADYLVKTANPDLSAERVVTDNTSITADWTVPDVVKFVREALTGEVTAPQNDNTLTVDKTAITNKAPATVAGGDLILISDIDDSNNLKQTTAQDIADLAGGSGITELTGDVTAGPGSGSQAATIANDAVTYAKMQNASAVCVLGAAFGAGDIAEIAPVGGSSGILVYDDGANAIEWEQGVSNGVPRVISDNFGMGAIPLDGGANFVSGDLPIADGGTGASTAADARNNLGLGGAANVIFNSLTAAQLKATGYLAALCQVAGNFYLQIISGGTALTADRVLTIDVNNANRELDITGNASISGTNTGDQTIELTGDVTGSGTGSFAATIDESAITGKPAATAAAGDLILIIDVDDANNFKKTTAQDIANLASGAGITQLTGDVTAGPGSGSQAATIANDAVTYAKMQNVSATDRLLGRSTAGAGNVEEIPCTAAGRALIDDASATDQRTTLGLGTMATQNANAVGITGGSINGVTVTATLFNGVANEFSNTSLRVLDDSNSFALSVIPLETLSAARSLQIVTGDATRTLTFAGDATISGTNTGDQTLAGLGGLTQPQIMARSFAGC